MSEILVLALILTVGIALWFGGLSFNGDGYVARCVDACHSHWVNRHGPMATARPIQDIAVDLRRLLREYDRLGRRSAGWQSAHHRRACELALRTCTEEAAAALGLPPGVYAADRPFSSELSRQLQLLAQAGLVLPESALPGRDAS